MVVASSAVLGGSAASRPASDPGTPPGEPITVDFTPVNGGTKVTLHQVSKDFSEEQVTATIYGYNSFFDDMEKLLAQLT